MDGWTKAEDRAAAAAAAAAMTMGIFNPNIRPQVGGAWAWTLGPVACLGLDPGACGPAWAWTLGPVDLPGPGPWGLGGLQAGLTLPCVMLLEGLLPCPPK
jgi:hypothetical protein